MVDVSPSGWVMFAIIGIPLMFLLLAIIGGIIGYIEKKLRKRKQL